MSMKAYPELIEKKSRVVQIVAEEEQAFSDLLERGVKYFEELAAELKVNIFLCFFLIDFF